MKKHTIYACLIFSLLAVQFVSAQIQGTVKVDTIISNALAGNVSKEDNKRAVSVYLPPSYSTSDKRYPVIYLLHGTGDNHLNFVDDSDKYKTIQGLMETGISSRRFGEMIVVTPNENTKWGGSFYVNSSVTGNWEDFTAKELVSFIDANYRTIAKSESRAIVGHSMGGFGAITLAMKYPDVFSVAYGLNSGFLSFTDDLNPNNPDVRKFIEAKTIEELLATRNQISIGMLMVAQAFSPNPNDQQFLADKPYKIEGKELVPNQPAYDKWAGFDVVRMADKYKENLMKLRAIKFDCGDKEDIKLIEINSRLFSNKLTSLGIPHQFEQYNGDHRNRLWGLKGRIYNEVLPFVFDNLGIQPE
jgi:S-formylglutathione hydrolase FrmB